MSAELRAAVVDVCATFKRCLALVRLYDAGHDTVRDLALQAGQKLRAALALAAATTPPSTTLTLTVEARSLSFLSKPVFTDDGTESAAAVLFVDGLAAVVFDAAITDDAVVTFVRLWGRAADRRAPLPSDQTFSTLIWDSALAGLTLVPQADDASHADGEALAALARRQALVAKLSTTTSLPLAPTTHPPPTLPSLDVDRALASLASGTLLALAVAAPDERPAILRLFTRALRDAVVAGDFARAADAFTAAVNVARARALDHPAVMGDLDAVCSCLGDEAVEAAFADAAAAGADGNELIKPLRFVPRRLVSVVVSLSRAPAARAAVTQRLAQLTIAEGEWRTFVDTAGAAGVEVIFAVARGKGPAEAALVVDAARGLGDGVFGDLLRQLRGPELEAAHKSVTAAAASPSLAPLAEDLLVRLKDPAVLPRLLQRVVDESRPVDQRKSATVAVTRFDVDAARAGLRAAFVGVKSDDVKCSIASALATLKDASARPMLEAIAKRLIVDRALKKACEDAVARLDAGAAS